MIRTMLFAVLALAFASPMPVRADEDDVARAARWDDLRHAVFGDRVVQDGTEFIALEAPPRALDAALVPITVTVAPGSNVKAIYLMVDENPSPLAGTFHFGPAGDPSVIKTRIRVDRYTLVHAVAETEDGQLFAAERFVKAAGGCSAPSGKDAEAAAQRLGQMQMRMAANDRVQLLVSHPNNNGMQVDQVTHLTIPARFIQDIKVTRGDALVFDLEADISLSEDPAITFGVNPASARAPLAVEVHDSANAVFTRSFELFPNG